MVVLFEGTDGKKVGELIDQSIKGDIAHSGGVFGLAWSPCGQRIATASGDKTVKIWNANSMTLEKTIAFGDCVEDQQIGISWSCKALVSLSLAGFLNFMDDSGVIHKIVHGHNKGITTLAISDCKKWLVTSDFEGNITRWNVTTAQSKRISPSLHKSQIRPGFYMKISIPNIDSLPSTTVKLLSQPVGLACSNHGDITIVACCKNIFVFQDKKLSMDLSVTFNPTCVAFSGNHVAVGAQDSKVHVYLLNGTVLSEHTLLPHTSPITSVSFSPNGEFLVATDSGRKVVPYSVTNNFKNIAEKEWTFHVAKVNCVAWSIDNRHIATGGLDTNIIIWDIQRSGEHPIIIKGAHAMSPVNGLAFLSENELLSVGQDANVKHWKINF
ncbi:WD domain, G-beta repeat protein [Dictyocaulus viviparus]|uniref:Actin-interacting protein 1 n=1 Tax=Dictyocaulus viviparus TaxID=29172 RepID=A0A0D8XJR7_DICVI|nr:WD domain, G-beta repeat protein [Dictyocaulus viviparus]